MTDSGVDLPTAVDALGPISVVGVAGVVTIWLTRAHRTATAALNDLNDRLARAVSTLESRVGTLTGERDTASDQAATARAEVISLRSQLTYKDQVIAAKDARIAALEDRLGNGGGGSITG